MSRPPLSEGTAILVVILVGLVVLITAVLAVLAAVTLVLPEKENVLMVREYPHEQERKPTEVEKLQSERPQGPNGVDRERSFGSTSFLT